jgi:isoquinoline 1-oxidoreductase beta subunit
MMNNEMTRRSFIKTGSLVVAVTVISGKFSLLNVSNARAEKATTIQPHAFVEIATDDTVTVWLGQTNLGQGTHTGISMIVAEELDADWDKVQAKMAMAAKPFNNPYFPMQFTGGSTSIRTRWDLLRKAGAGVRHILVEAAANEWGVNSSNCTTENSSVVHPDGRKLSYGQLVEAAGNLTLPDDPPLKDPKNYRIIGSRRDRLDIPDKVAGRTKYGIDVMVPGMCIAVVARPPRFGATPESFDEDAAMKVRGVIKVVQLPDRVAVCAETTFAALQGRDKLAIKWTAGALPELNDEVLDKIFQDHLQKDGAVAESIGDTDKALAEAETTLESSYKLPYLAHAQLEPINCTAKVEKDRVHLWVPTQGQTWATMAAAKVSGLPAENIEVMTTPAGGGFGIRGMTDPVVDSVMLAKMLGRPVKVMWTREDDFANDYFRPGSVCTIKGGLDKSGRLVAWSHKVASPAVMAKIMPQRVKDGIDETSIEGIHDMVYTLPNRHVEYVLMDLPIPIGFWRSVGYSINTFTVETFMDQLAHAAGKDPVEFRFALLKKDSRPFRTLSLLVEKSGWGSSVPEGRARGMALGSCFGSAVAHMAEVSVDRKSGNIKVHKIVCAIDCGPAVYPDAIIAQMEGAAVMALSTAFGEKIHFTGGGVETANFDEYPLLTISSVPEIEVYISDSIHKIGGIGEPGVPTIAPSVANAVFNATGVMFNEMPFDTELLTKG